MKHFSRLGLWLLLMVAAVAAVSCNTGSGTTDFKSTVVTDANSAQLAADAKSALSYEDYALVQSYIKRVNPELPEGRFPAGITVGAMIESQKAFIQSSGAVAVPEGSGTSALAPAQTAGQKEEKPAPVSKEESTSKERPGSQASKTAAPAAPVAPPPPAAPSAAPQTKVETPATPPPPTTAVLPAGTNIEIRLTEAVSSATARAGDTFGAVLDRDLVVDGHLLAKAGSDLVGKVKQATPSGKVKGRATMSIEVVSINTGGKTHNLPTVPLSFQAEGSGKKDATKIGIATGVGTLIGAIAGGKKGAAIGAVVGGGAGTGVVLSTKGDEVSFPSEQRISFEIAKEVELPIIPSAKN